MTGGVAEPGIKSVSVMQMQSTDTVQLYLHTSKTVICWVISVYLSNIGNSDGFHLGFHKFNICEVTLK